MSADMCQGSEVDFLGLLQRRRPDLSELLTKPVFVLSDDLAGQLYKAATFATECTAPIQSSRVPAGQPHNGAPRILSIRAQIEGLPKVRQEGCPVLPRSPLAVPAKGASHAVSVPRASESEALEAICDIAQGLEAGEEGEEYTSDEDGEEVEAGKTQLKQVLRTQSEPDYKATYPKLPDDAHKRHISASSCGAGSDTSPPRLRRASSPNGVVVYDDHATVDARGQPPPFAAPTFRDMASHLRPSDDLTTALRLDGVCMAVRNHPTVEFSAAAGPTDASAAAHQSPPVVRRPHSFPTGLMPLTHNTAFSSNPLPLLLPLPDCMPLRPQQHHQHQQLSPDPEFGQPGGGGGGAAGGSGSGEAAAALMGSADGPAMAALQAAAAAEGGDEGADRPRRPRRSRTLLSLLPADRPTHLSNRLQRLRSQLDHCSRTPESPPLCGECSSPLMRTSSSPARLMTNCPLPFGTGGATIASCVGDACEGEPEDPALLEHLRASPPFGLEGLLAGRRPRGRDASGPAGERRERAGGSAATDEEDGGAAASSGDGVAAAGCALPATRQTMHIPVRQPQPPVLPYGGILRLAVSHGSGGQLLSNAQRYATTLGRPYQQQLQQQGRGLSLGRGGGGPGDGGRGGGGGGVVPPQPTLSRGGLVMQNIGCGEIRGVIGLQDSVRPRIQQAGSPAGAPASPARLGDLSTSRPRRLPQSSDSGGCMPRLESGAGHPGSAPFGSESGGAGADGVASRTLPCLADFLASSGMEIESPTGRLNVLGNCRPTAAAATPALLPSLKHQKGLKGSPGGPNRQRMQPQHLQPQQLQQLQQQLQQLHMPPATQQLSAPPRSPQLQPSPAAFLVRQEHRRSYCGAAVEGALGGHGALLDSGVGSVTVMLAVTDSVSGLQDVRQHRHYKLGYAPAPTPPGAVVRCRAELSPGKASSLLPVIGHQGPASTRAAAQRPSQGASVPFPIVSPPRAE